ncbi:MAG: SDR family NAD(P)-dependent oxidoreductase [Rhodobacteraceae bacterium]|nr:SDR family NAD(P)-dependent oxidoreductase [Paracoccaceae bacterium]
MSFSIERKTAIVTGAANGVGLAIARHFTNQGANVMFADRDAKRLKSELSGETGNAEYFAGDLRDRLSINNLLAATLSRFNRVDILVNASRQVTDMESGRSPAEVLDTALDQNLKQHFNLSRLIARRFKEQAKENEDSGESAGAIVNISSIASHRSHEKLVEFSLSCAALDQMTRSMAVALAGSRIRVNAVALGSVMSNSLSKAIQGKSSSRAGIIEATPLGRIADASEVAEVVQFLASEGAGFITGQIIAVDGGRSLLDRSVVPYH